MTDEPAYFKCTKTEPFAPFTVGTVYEVHSYKGTSAVIVTDTEECRTLPVWGCQFTPHDPWASYRAQYEGTAQ